MFLIVKNIYMLQKSMIAGKIFWEGTVIVWKNSNGINSLNRIKNEKYLRNRMLSFGVIRGSFIMIYKKQIRQFPPKTAII